MKFKQILFEAAIEDYKRKLEQYLDPADGQNLYDFPHLPDVKIRIEKNFMGDFGYMLSVQAIRNGNLIGSARVMQGSVDYLDESGRRVDSADYVPDPPKLFGRLVEIIK